MPEHFQIPSPRESGERARERGRRALSGGQAPLPPRFARRPLNPAGTSGPSRPTPAPRGFAAPSPAARGEASLLTLASSRFCPTFKPFVDKFNKPFDKLMETLAQRSQREA
jgi:hypothetical protein